ncbi:hypothetical protein I6N98_05525 [Spongiibacter nanhainus]|uniref:Uncharacterized protein n=1 Tax=Spongiibacter nanhainus TaxID=2794344 RepID=A0A7T4R2L1_9GAMM|nr:hypothetical protein [Spongiibacter nanhainus]QQD19314.1 hypothetical protein I6N98_05525 [Spongiibacter nanhainus]
MGIKVGSNLAQCWIFSVVAYRRAGVAARQARQREAGLCQRWERVLEG